MSKGTLVLKTVEGGFKNTLFSPQKRSWRLHSRQLVRDKTLCGQLRLTVSNFGHIIGAIRRKRYLTPQQFKNNLECQQNIFFLIQRNFIH